MECWRDRSCVQIGRVPYDSPWKGLTLVHEVDHVDRWGTNTPTPPLPEANKLLMDDFSQPNFE